jgi:hypothetical protein
MDAKDGRQKQPPRVQEGGAHPCCQDNKGLDTGEMPGVRQDSTGHRVARNVSEPRPRPRTSARLTSVALRGEIVSSASTCRPRKNRPASAERRKLAAWVFAHKKHCRSPTHDYALPPERAGDGPEHLHRGRREHGPGVAEKWLPPPSCRPALTRLPPLAGVGWLRAGGSS